MVGGGRLGHRTIGCGAVSDALEIEAQVRLGGLDLAVELRVAADETVALLGPNGSGKTTLLRAVAGLQPLDAGSIRLDGVTLDAPATHTLVPAERRPVGVVFQDYLLFPHLSARENVAFGLRARKVGRREAGERADRWLERVGLGTVGALRAGQLSGGQQQRVALARALATEPRLLLLDEKLAALDVGTRAEVRRELRRHLDGHDGPRILVTHDPLDAYALADRVVVLERGNVTHRGTLTEITAHPRSDYVGRLVGTNLLDGVLEGTVLRLSGGGVLVVPNGEAVDGPCLATVAPSAIALHRDAPTGSPRNAWSATVAELDRFGDRVRVRLDGPVPLAAEVTAAAAAELDIRSGDTVWASVKATEVKVYPA